MSTLSNTQASQHCCGPRSLAVKQQAWEIGALELAEDDALALDGGEVAVLVHHVHVLHPVLRHRVVLYLVDLHIHP